MVQIGHGSCRQFRSSCGKSIGTRKVDFRFRSGSDMSFTGTVTKQRSLIGMVMVLVKTKNLWYHPCGFEKNVYSWIHVWDRNIINGFQKIEGLNNIATIPYGDKPKIQAPCNIKQSVASGRSKIRKRSLSALFGCRPWVPMDAICLVRLETFPRLS